MDRLTNLRIARLMSRIDIIQKKIRIIIKSMSMSNDETIGYWTQKEKELKWEYEALRFIFRNILQMIVESEYYKGLKDQIVRFKNLKSLKINKDFRQYQKAQIHKRAIRSIIERGYTSFLNGINTDYRNIITLIQKMQHAIIKVNRIRIENDAD